MSNLGQGQIWSKNGFKTIILIYPENLVHLDIFLSEKGQLKKFGPLPPKKSLYIKKHILFSTILINMVLLVIIQKIWAIFAHWGGFYSPFKLACLCLSLCCWVHFLLEPIRFIWFSSNFKLGSYLHIPKIWGQYLLWRPSKNVFCVGSRVNG